jgi:tetratricopeptide (TPR) repeat protein
MGLKQVKGPQAHASRDVETLQGRQSLKVFVKPRAIFVATISTVLFAATTLPAFAAGELAQPATSSSASSSVPNTLPELPKLAPIAVLEADPGALQDLDRLLERLTTGDARARETAKTSIVEVTPSVVAAIRSRVLEIRTSLDRKEAQGLLDDARKAGRKALKKDKPDPKTTKKKGAKAKEEAEDDGDWLEFVLAQSKPKNDTWVDLVKLLAMERMLTNVGTTPAVRELLQMYSYFGELLRIDLARQMSKLRDKAVPALIEARQHDAKIVQRFAVKQLDLLGRTIPGEAVGVTDPQVLADILRAYGRTRDVDAVRVILSFCNSDRIKLRESAREAITAIGEPGIWQLRDAYLNQTGNKAPREFTWDRIARELFGMYDRARLAEVYKLMDEGVAHASAKKWLEATDAFDKVLARSPIFDRRKEMAPAYVERAKELETKEPALALEVLRKALRLDPKGDGAKKIEAEIAYLEGVALIEKGTPDKFPLTKAIEIDPTHERAKRALAELEQERVAPKKSFVRRYLAAGGVGFAALLAMIVLVRIKPKKRAEQVVGAPTDAGSTEPPA